MKKLIDQLWLQEAREETLEGLTGDAALATQDEQIA
jgi:hypothetical protein